MTQEKSNSLVPGEAIDKATGKLIEKLGLEVGDGIVGFAGNILGLAFYDRLKEARRRNQLSGLRMTAEHLHSLGVRLDALGELDELSQYAIFEGLADESDTMVQSLWAGLLSNMLSSKLRLEPSNEVLAMLRQMNGQDVAGLKLLNELNLKSMVPYKDRIVRNDAGHVVGLSEQARDADAKTIALAKELMLISSANVISFDERNLLRMGLISYPDIDAAPNHEQLKMMETANADDLSTAMTAYFRSYNQNLSKLIQVNTGVARSSKAAFELSEGSAGWPPHIRTNIAITLSGKNLLEVCNQL